jgi:Zn-dependent protease with chaperone function
MSLAFLFLTHPVVAQVAVPQPTTLAVNYFDALFWLWLAQQVALLALPVFLLMSRCGVRAAGWLEKLVGSPRWLVAAALYSGLYALLYCAVRLPIDYFRALRLNPYFESPAPEPLAWLVGQIMPIAQTILVATVAGAIAFALIRKSPRWWWAWVSGAICVFVVGQLVLQPLLADARYVPLVSSEHSEWQDSIDVLAARTGAASVPVFVWQTNEQDFCRIQNSVVGLGPTRRVVLADQIFTEWDRGQIEVAFAHELKHYLFDNTWIPIVLIASLSLAGSLFVHVAGNRICRRWGRILRFESLARPAALPLIVALIQIYLLIAIPVFNLTAQHIELEADRFALELTRDNDARARVSADQCGRLWLPEDTLFARLYLHTHPSVAERIRLANDYRPWQTSDRLVYGDVISFE